MNRFLLLTGIGPSVSRDDALTWIQVVFVIITMININTIITNVSNSIITVNMMRNLYLQQRYMVPHAVWKMARLFCDQIHDR